MKRFVLSPMVIAMFALLIFCAYQNILVSGMTPMGWIMSKLYLLPGIVIGLSFHEFGHAFVADKLGDPTPKIDGRVTISPGAHIDVVGFVALILLGFGWGRPVAINPNNFKHPRRGAILVSIAGVVLNLIIALFFLCVTKIILEVTDYSTARLVVVIVQVLMSVVSINFILMIFNLLPVPPLDGFNLITDIFNLRKYSWWETLYRNGFFILMILIVFNVTDRFIFPPYQFLVDLAYKFILM